MNEPKVDSSDDGAAYAYHEPDPALKKLIGKSTILDDIFTKEKVASCQKMIDEAKSTFFDTARPDIDTISALTKDKAFADNYPELCKQIFQPVSNIKGQAAIFGFPLVTCVCKYLIEYCNSSKSKHMTARDIFIITKLVEVLHRAFREKIVDAGGVIEKELVAIVEQARK